MCAETLEVERGEMLKISMCVSDTWGSVGGLLILFVSIPISTLELIGLVLSSSINFFQSLFSLFLRIPSF